MKRGFLFLALIMLIQLGCRVVPVLAENEEDILAIEKVINDFYETASKFDWDSARKLISDNYSYIDEEGRVLDYVSLISMSEERSKMSGSSSIVDLKINNADVQGNKATLEIEFTVKSLDPRFNINMKQKRLISLVKEDGSWKIMQSSQYKAP